LRELSNCTCGRSVDWDRRDAEGSWRTARIGERRARCPELT
jgi:hypothetical protein